MSRRPGTELESKRAHITTTYEIPDDCWVLIAGYTDIESIFALFFISNSISDNIYQSFCESKHYVHLEDILLKRAQNNKQRRQILYILSLFPVKDLKNPLAVIKLATNNAKSEASERLFSNILTSGILNSNDIAKAYLHASLPEVPKLVDIIQKYVPVNCCDNLLIRQLAKKGDSKWLSELITNPLVDPSARDDEALRNACTNGHTDCVRLLLSDERCNPGVLDNYCLIWAASCGFDEIVRMLVDHSKVGVRSITQEVASVAINNNRRSTKRLLKQLLENKYTYNKESQPEYIMLRDSCSNGN